MYEVALFKRNNVGRFVRVFHSVDATPWRAKELASSLRMHPLLRDGSDAVYVSTNDKYKMYVTRLNRWW
jgi:hypothetical protein